MAYCAIQAAALAHFFIYGVLLIKKGLHMSLNTAAPQAAHLADPNQITLGKEGKTIDMRNIVYQAMRREIFCSKVVTKREASEKSLS